MKQQAMTRKLHIAIALLAGMWLAGCDDAGGGPVRNGSPRELLTSLHRIAEADAFEALARTKPPAVQPHAAEMLKQQRRLVEHARKTADRIEPSIGKARAEILRRWADQMTPHSPLEKVVGGDGRIKWRKVEIAEGGDRAVVTLKVDEPPPPLELARVDGAWYVAGENERPQRMEQLAEQSRRRTDDLIGALDRLAEGIAAGDITPENFHAHYRELILSTR